jgi:hypothetical protein
VPARRTTEVSSTHFALTLLAAAVLASAAALPASAKDGVQATLKTSIPLDAAAGTRVRVAWKLFSVEGRGKERPFGAGGVFVRLLSASGADAEEGLASVAPLKTGEYEATVVVPEGGIRDVLIGLHGWTSGANGTHQADRLFTITNDPVPRAAAPALPSPGAPRRAETDSNLWVFVLVAVLVSAVAVGTATRRLAIKT